jgi:hypothetical protein
LYNFEVFEGKSTSKDLTDVHFIKLKLKDNAGKLLSENFYWRGNRRKDFTALNTLAKVDLKVNSKVEQSNGKYYIKAQITNPASAPAVAFAIRIQAVNSATGAQILTAIIIDNYFTLLKGETKEVQIEFEAGVLGKGTPKLLVEPYNNPITSANE